MDEYFKKILKTAPYLVIIGLILWIISTYRQMKLQEKLAAMQIKKLENELGIKADDKAVDSVFQGSAIERASSLINI
jgi:hypothetical protein